MNNFSSGIFKILSYDLIGEIISTSLKTDYDIICLYVRSSDILKLYSIFDNKNPNFCDTFDTYHDLIKCNKFKTVKYFELLNPRDTYHLIEDFEKLTPMNYETAISSFLTKRNIFETNLRFKKEIILLDNKFDKNISNSENIKIFSTLINSINNKLYYKSLLISALSGNPMSDEKDDIYQFVYRMVEDIKNREDVYVNVNSLIDLLPKEQYNIPFVDDNFYKKITIYSSKNTLEKVNFKMSGVDMWIPIDNPKLDFMSLRELIELRKLLLSYTDDKYDTIKSVVDELIIQNHK